MLCTSWMIAFALGLACASPESRTNQMCAGLIVLMALLFGDWYEPTRERLKNRFPGWFGR